jgi:hypothetical protein
MENENFVLIQLKNLFGQTVRDIPVNENMPCQLSLEGIASGTYFVYFKSEAKSYARKLVIRN